MLTFRQCCAKYLSAHSDEWSNAEHREQWRQTLETYAGPVIGQLNVAHVDDALVLQILEPIWKTKTETAKRLRGRIERVLGWATVHKYRTGDNPARWRGHLDHMLAKPSKIVQTKNHPALPYFRVAELMAELRAKRSVGARALQFLILTAARSGEVRGAEWSEIDFANGIWTVPAARMKMRVEHRVPLSAQALAVLEQMREQQMGAFIFPGRREGEVMSDMTLVSVLRRMGHPDIVPHGFRSTFRDWAAECTGYPRELAEVALAHKVGDETERAYQRGDLLEKRRRLMRDWAAWCDRPATPATVTSIRHG